MTEIKEHKEFFPLNLVDGWSKLDGYPSGIQEKVLAGWLDEKNGRGNRTRLLRFEPDTHTSEPFVHDYFEEVFLLRGDLYVGSDPDGRGGERFEPYTYACRPPGTPHGPFRSEKGCLLLEVHFYPETQP